MDLETQTTDAQTQTTRRTQADLRYLADGNFFGGDADPKRNSRIRSHGWIDGQGRYTTLGRDLAYVTRTLIGRGRFDRVMDAIGLAEYVDVIDAHGGAALGQFALLLSVQAIADDVVDSRDDNFGLVEDASPVKRISFRRSDGRVADYVTVVGVSEASPSFTNAFEREAQRRGYTTARPFDDRTKSGRSKTITTVHRL